MRQCECCGQELPPVEIDWPLEFTMYFHRSKDSNSYDIGDVLEDAGMTPEEVQEWWEKTDYKALYAGYEIGVTARLHSDGRVDIIEVE